MPRIKSIKLSKFLIQLAVFLPALIFFTQPLQANAALELRILPKYVDCPNASDVCFNNKCCPNGDKDKCDVNSYCSHCIGEAPGTGGDCYIGDFLMLGTNLANDMLYLLGIAALLVFLYGGFLFLTSAGEPKKVATGKSIMMQTILAILIVLLAWVIVRAFQELIGLNPEYYLETVPSA